ncbi:uncharacterized protein LOC130663548 [Microplitis mediator]|uniref:uncharacterized protein LOC130663548 n=1 Tax=Microplitis mediator TaxID=375433 RepID=UPI002553EC4D|nr:uncharacterized protein LOC130663548 [Microplitis mediator]
MSRRSNTGRRTLNLYNKNKHIKGRRYTLSADAQAALSNLLEDVIENTLEDAKKMAETAGKSKVSIEEIERALKKLCKSFCSQSSVSNGQFTTGHFYRPHLKRHLGS